MYKDNKKQSSIYDPTNHAIHFLLRHEIDFL